MDKLPLNDPRWRTMRAAIDQREKQLGDCGLAIRNLEREMEAGQQRTMRRNRTTGEAERLIAPFWKTHFIGYLGPSFVTICRQTDSDRHKTDGFGNLVAEPLSDWLFYGWQPDSDKLYPVGRARVDGDDDSNSPPRVRPGPKPTGDWPDLIARWLIEVSHDDPQKLQKPNVDELAIEAELFLRNQNKWAPKDIKAIRARILELLTPVRR